MPTFTSPASGRRRRALRRLRSMRRRLARRARRGSALMLVLILTFAMAALVLSGMFLGANATALSKSFDKEQDFKYAAEGAISVGKSRLNNDALVLPDSGYSTLVSGGILNTADGKTVGGLTYNLYVGPTGSTTGQFGRFASVVAEARDVHGARFVRRLELTQESFAKFAYWSNREETAGGAAISFGAGDQLWGPVWSNDSIRVTSGGATFHDDVGTARVVLGQSFGTFKKGYKENEKPIPLPTLTNLSKLPGYAAAGGLSYAAINSGNETTVRTRVEFISIDLSQPADGDSTDADEGYLRVYDARPGQERWLRGDYADTVVARRMCGDFHTHNGVSKFYPAAAHNTGMSTTSDQTWFRNQTGASQAHARLPFRDLMATASARCYLGGAPQLVYSERDTSIYDAVSQRNKGGEDTTFTQNGRHGVWRVRPGTAYAPLLALTTTPTANRRRSVAEVNSLFALHRTGNADYKGVVHVNGTAAVSGTLRGRVTMYATGSIILVDDMRYATDPAAAGGRCNDILGLLAANNIVLSDNAIFTPQAVTGLTKTLDDTKDAYVQAVLMALNTSFFVQNFNSGPNDVNDCQGINVGRGCLYMTGGLIQNTRGAVGTTGGNGFVKRYSYDRCAAMNPPPYFPTTGRFLDNRYYEIDPVRFDVATLFRSLTPTQ